MLLANAFATASGFVREVVIAHRLGTSSTADAFALVMFFLETLQTVAVSGIATFVLIPFIARSAKSQNADVDEVAIGTVVFGSIIAVALVALLMGTFAGPIVGGILSETSASTQVAARRLLRLSSAGFPLIFAAGLVGTILQGRGRFSAPALGRMVLNGTIAAGLFLLVPTMGLTGGAIAVLGAGIVQLLFVAWYLKRVQYPLPLSFKDSPRLRAILSMAAPALVVVMFSNVILGSGERYFVSTVGEGSLAVLSYAWRLYFLLLGWGISLQAVTFTRLSERTDAANPSAGTIESIVVSLRAGIFTLVPTALAAALVAEPLVTVAYYRGQFGMDSLAATISVFAAYLPSLIPAFAIGIVMRSQFALEMGWTAVRTAIVWAGVSLLTDAVLTPTFGLIAVPIGFAIGCLAGTLYGIESLERRLGGRILGELFGFTAQVLLVAAVAFVPLALLRGWTTTARGLPGPRELIAFAVVAAICGGLFLAASMRLHIREAQALGRLLRLR